jgi:hypothetical protein
MPAIASRDTKSTTQEEQPQQEKLLCCGVADNKIIQASTFGAATLPKNNGLIPTKMPAIASRDTQADHTGRTTAARKAPVLRRGRQ